MTTGLLELGEILLTASERKLEIASRNVSNISTPGFKKSVTFQEALTDATGPGAARTSLGIYTDFAQGGLQLTGRPLDLAISGPGFFKLRSENGIYYSRGGQFERAADGRLGNGRGLFLQAAEGGDLVLSGAHAEITADGAVLEDGLPIAHIGVFEPSDDARLEALGGTLFAAPEENMQEAASPNVRQGMLETANVDTASEMIEMMAALRQAEAGARVVQAYDSLIGQSISTFGRALK